MAPPPVEALDDLGKLRRAEQLIERHNYDEANQIAEELAGREATNADYQALRALVLYHQFVGNKPTRALVEAIESALRLNAEHPRGLYLKGLVLKRMGKEAEAVRCFQKTIEVDPKHVDALRELRLAKMRRDR
jgi:tetratricopeptide (TPR) repeat protein